MFQLLGERDLVKDGSKKVCNKVLQLNGKKKGFACSSFSREIPPIYALKVSTFLLSQHFNLQYFFIFGLHTSFKKLATN